MVSRLESFGSVADWDLCTGRNVGTIDEDILESVADWDLCTGRN